MKLVEHPFDVAHDGNRTLPKAAQDTYQGVGQVRPGKKVVVQRGVLKLSRLVKYYTHFSRFMRMIDPMMWDIPSLITVYFFQRYLLCITT